MIKKQTSHFIEEIKIEKTNKISFILDSFDPINLKHVLLIEELIKQGIDKVVIIPIGNKEKNHKNNISEMVKIISSKYNETYVFEDIQSENLDVIIEFFKKSFGDYGFENQYFLASIQNNTKLLDFFYSNLNFFDNYIGNIILYDNEKYIKHNNHNFFIKNNLYKFNEKTLLDNIKRKKDISEFVTDDIKKYILKNNLYF